MNPVLLGGDLAGCARLFTTTFDAAGTLVLTVDDVGKAMSVAAVDPPVAESGTLRIPLGHGVIGLVAANGHPVRLNDDAPRNDAHRMLLGLPPGATVARMCLPARGLHGTTVAVVSLHRHSLRPYTDADIERAMPLADILGLRLHAERLEVAAELHHSGRDRLIGDAISAQEAERRRIAGDLHDGVAQTLASLNFHLSAADSALAHDAADTAAQQITTARQLASMAYDETRAAISGLHSLILDDLGLGAALESLTQSVPQLEIEFRADENDSFADVPNHCAAALYRIAQEALNNVVKHANAERVVLSIRRHGDAVVVGVTDDGVGFDVETARARAISAGDRPHFGLATIEERCALIDATLRIDSVEGRGTSVVVEL